MERVEIEDREDHLRLTAWLWTPTEEFSQSFVIVPLDANRARVAGIGRGLGDVVRVMTGSWRPSGAPSSRSERDPQGPSADGRVSPTKTPPPL